MHIYKNKKERIQIGKSREQELQLFFNESYNNLLQFFLLFTIEYEVPNRAIGLMSRVFTKIREAGVQSQIESYQRLKKWYLMPPSLTLRNGSRVKWSNPGKGVAPYTLV